MKPYRSIASLFKIPKRQLGYIIRQVKRLDQLNESFLKATDERFAQQCRITHFDFEKSELTLLVNNASWATKLRYMEQDLIELLRREKIFTHLKKIRVKVGNLPIFQAEKIASQKPYSQTGKSALTIAAKSIENEQLKNALNRLAEDLGQ